MGVNDKWMHATFYSILLYSLPEMTSVSGSRRDSAKLQLALKAGTIGWPATAAWLATTGSQPGWLL